MATTEEQLLGTAVTPFSSVSSTANNAYLAASAASNNAQGQTLGGARRARLTLSYTGTLFASTPTTPSSLYVWFLTSEDGTHFEMNGTSVALAPVRGPDGSIPFPASTSPGNLVADVALPVGQFVAYVQVANPGQAMTNWTLSITPYFTQMV